MSKRLKLTDIMVTVVIAVVCAVIYKLWTPLYYALQPLGFRADQLIYSMWFVAAPLAFLIIRKPGVALLAEMAAASGEFITGSEWGVSVFMAGLLQGLFAELAFAAFRYKKYSLGVAAFSGVAATFGSFLMDLYYNYIDDLSLWNVTLLIGARALGSILICGVLAYYVVKALEATGVTNLIRPASRADYDSLNR